VSTLPVVLARIESAFDSRLRRGALMTLSAAVLVAGIVAVAEKGDTGTSSVAHKLPTIAQIEQRRYGDQIVPPKSAILTARSFIKDAVLREDLRAAWGMTTTGLRGQSMTRKHWLTGSIPLVPYPKDAFGQAGIQIRRSRERSILLLVLITPRAGNATPRQDYYLELVPRDGRWLVNYWAPKGRIDAPVPRIQ
jgi:hypothetical protein